jgi:hypothetical protein
VSLGVRAKVARFRNRMREAGLRPVTLLAVDSRSTDFLVQVSKEVAGIGRASSTAATMEWLKHIRFWQRP